MVEPLISSGSCIALGCHSSLESSYLHQQVFTGTDPEQEAGHTVFIIMLEREYAIHTWQDKRGGLDAWKTIAWDPETSSKVAVGRPG
jgi:hypothetical protein